MGARRRRWLLVGTGWDIRDPYAQLCIRTSRRDRYRALKAAHRGEVAGDELAAAFIASIASRPSSTRHSDRALRVRLGLWSLAGAMLAVAGLVRVGWVLGIVGLALAVVTGEMAWHGPARRNALVRAHEVNSAHYVIDLASYAGVPPASWRERVLAVVGLWISVWAFTFVLFLVVLGGFEDVGLAATAAAIGSTVGGVLSNVLTISGQRLSSRSRRSPGR